MGLVLREDRLRTEWVELLQRVDDVVRSRRGPRPKAFDAG